MNENEIESCSNGFRRLDKVQVKFKVSAASE